MAIAVKEAVEFVGLPEGIIPLAQGVTYLASAPKSNASYRAMAAARADAREHGSLPVPLHLRNAPTGLMRGLGYGAGYEYAHDFEGAVSDQTHLPELLAAHRYYEPSDRGYEARIREYLDRVRAMRAASKPNAKEPKG
jgi:putative ATPase